MSDDSMSDPGILGTRETEIGLGSWGDFVREFARNDAPNWIFRGQASLQWPLVTSLQRAFESVGIVDEVHRAGMENSTIGFFKERARLHLDRSPDEHDLLSWLAVMQHYGAPTRLQDWTQSPFVGAYFAYRDHPDEDAAVWALQAFFCRRKLTPVMVGQPWDHLGILEAEYLDEDGDQVTVYPWTALTPTGVENDVLRDAIRGGNGWPLPILPLSYDHRMAAQQAVFLAATRTDFALELLMEQNNWPDPVPPERFAEQMAQMERKYPLAEPGQLIKRIKLPAAWRSDALRTLRQMGISEETMFPGLDGVGRAASMYLKGGEYGLRDALHSLGP